MRKIIEVRIESRIRQVRVRAFLNEHFLILNSGLCSRHTPETQKNRVVIQTSK